MRKAIEKGQHGLAALFDLKKAFVTVDHNLLFENLIFLAQKIKW